MNIYEVFYGGGIVSKNKAEYFAIENGALVFYKTELREEGGRSFTEHTAISALAAGMGDKVKELPNVD